MKPVNFLGCNVVFAKDQPQYQPLPALRTPEGVVVTCFELTNEELETVVKNKRIYLSVLTFNQPLQPLLPVVDLAELIELK